MSPVAIAYFALADGSIWQGTPFGKRGRTTGEAVFNTSMTGYQEILTDPSYCRQIVVMTAPHIGNTGVNDEDAESHRPWVAGFGLRKAPARTSSWRASQSLESYLAENDIVGITGLDTRAIVAHIRDRGAMPAAIVSDGGDQGNAVATARAASDINRQDLVGQVTCRESYTWDEPAESVWYPLIRTGAGPESVPMASLLDATPDRSADDAVTGGLARPHVVVWDFGVKRNTLRLLVTFGCRVTVVPARTSAADILALAPDGVLLSNGPGDPAALGDIVTEVRRILGRVPVFGICMGHQLLGLALGGSTYKLRFGHRGGNQPVRDPSGHVAISSHNHGFAVNAEGLPAWVRVTHENLNDGCVEGLAAPRLGAFSVQYHPEAGPGPHDAIPLFREFLKLMQPPIGDLD